MSDTILSQKMQDAATATGNGTPMLCTGYATAMLDVTITNTATVTFEVCGIAGVYTAVPALNMNTQNSATTATATGLYRVDVAGCENLRARISSYTSGSVTVWGAAVEPASATIAFIGATPVDSELPNAAALADAIANPTTPLVGSAVQAFNSTTWDRVRTNAAAVVSSATQPFAQLMSPPGQWAVNHSPAANTQATASKAAGGAGVRHVCNTVSATFTAGGTEPTATTATLNLRDGATGAGSVVMSWTLGVEATAGRTTTFFVSGLNVVGSANTAMTLEFSAAGGANTLESVSMSGYSTV